MSSVTLSTPPCNADPPFGTLAGNLLYISAALASAAMPNAFRLLTALVLCALAAPGAEARISTKRFERIEFGGLRLGMDFSHGEAMLRARRDWSEPHAALGRGYDCAGLLPDGKEVGYNPDLAPRRPEDLSFSDAGHHDYYMHFDATPTGSLVTRIGYREFGMKGGWEVYLARMVRRFGEPDLIKPADRDGNIEAYWCEKSEERCDEHADDAGGLSLTWYPDFGVSKGDAIERGAAAYFSLDEGRARWDARYKSTEALTANDPAAAKRLYAQCVSPEGKFADETALDSHVLGLVRYLDGESATLWSPRQVPDGVFSALGIDAKRTFGEGVCFHSSDVIFERPECPGGISMTGFRWARSAGNRWLVSLMYGGVALRRRYYVVEAQPDGSFRKVWWDSGLAPLCGWLAAGAKPMTGKSW